MELKNMSKLEILNAVKNEIERIGIQDDPRRMDYMRLFDPETAPAATTAMYNLDMSWKEIVNAIGYKYDSNSYSLTRDEMIDLTIKAIKKNDIKSFTQYQKTKGLNAPSVVTLTTNEIYWKDIQMAYKEKYGDFIKTKGESIPWKLYSDEEISDIIVQFMKKNSIRTLAEYEAKRTKNEPSMAIAKARFGGSVASVASELHNKLGFNPLLRNRNKK